MNDIATVASMMKNTLLELGKQQQILGEGLLNAAPGEKIGVPNNSVQYLLVGSEYLLKVSKQCDEFISTAAG